MTKRTITIMWLVGIGVMIAGGLLALFCSLALASHIGTFTANYQYTTYVPDGIFWALVSFIVLGGIAVLGGIVTQIVAWIGAVINVNRLVDKTWYNVLLWCGVAGIVLTVITGLGAMIGWVLMIVYLVGGPDGLAVEPMLLRATPTEPPIKIGMKADFLGVKSLGAVNVGNGENNQFEFHLQGSHSCFPLSLCLTLLLLQVYPEKQAPHCGLVGGIPGYGGGVQKSLGGMTTWTCGCCRRI